MSDERISAAEQAYYARLAAEVEACDTLPEGSVVTTGVGDAPGREFLSQFMTPDELDAAVARGRGRPRLAPGSGQSPRRQVRLPEDVDAQLMARAVAEQRPVSAVLRDAVTAYLRAS
ncbi:MAG: ribbon-helix-helix protein, CopG family [Micrococcales bacterium]|nr:ribbon-helix-helix protein, CopG family [Micrococcales bacterium]